MPISRIVFAGQDAGGNANLWATTRSPDGTSELVVPGANAAGLFNAAYFPSGFSPDFTVVRNAALFEGYDANGVDSLWVTDGTSGGTSQLSVVGSFSGGLFANVTAPNLIAFAGRALFVGEDASGNIGLWSTDGTGTGTAELTIAGADAGGIFSNVAYPGFTVLGGEILFAGQDASGNSNLWVTDGTSAHTNELAVAGANSGGLFNISYFPAGFSPDFTVLGNRALFEGYDAFAKDSPG
jgi:hypothetical protein